MKIHSTDEIAGFDGPVDWNTQLKDNGSNIINQFTYETYESRSVVKPLPAAHK